MCVFATLVGILRSVIEHTFGDVLFEMIYTFFVGTRHYEHGMGKWE